MTDPYGVPYYEPADSSDDDKVEYVPPNLRASSSSSSRRRRQPQWQIDGYGSYAEWRSDKRQAELWEKEYDLLHRSERGPVVVASVSSDEDDETPARGSSASAQYDWAREEALLRLSEKEEKAAQLLASIKKNNPPEDSPVVRAYHDCLVEIRLAEIFLDNN